MDSTHSLWTRVEAMKRMTPTELARYYRDLMDRKKTCDRDRAKAKRKWLTDEENDTEILLIYGKEIVIDRFLEVKG